jgi:hypothetical protein
MVLHVEKTEKGWGISLTDEMAETMRLVDGGPVQVLPVEESAVEPRVQIRYASVEEVMKAHRETEPRHAAAYRELAK